MSVANSTHQIENIKIQMAKNITTFTVHATHSFKSHIFSLKNPERIVIDLEGVKPGEKEKQYWLKQLKKWMASAKVQDIRMASHGKNGFRIVIELPKPVKPIVKTFNKAIDVSFKVSANQKIEKQHYRDVLVIIDPGHGGKDPGTSGRKRTREKNVVLKIAKNLASIINKEPGMRAILTRTGDYFITLRGRLRIARKANADMFVSIHADSEPSRRARGVSVYALSRRGATSEAARWLAHRENFSELGGAEFEDKSKALRSVLLDLSQSATIADSLRLGLDVIRSVNKYTRVRHKKVEQARFVVLKSPDIPSLLIETGYLTNRYDENLLRSSTYRKKLANSIFQGIKKYLWLHPPAGTKILAKKRGVYQTNEVYNVQRGDSLGKIASKFHLSTSALKRYNHLSHNTIYIGQKLKIPGMR